MWVQGAGFRVGTWTEAVGRRREAIPAAGRRARLEKRFMSAFLFGEM